MTVEITIIGTGQIGTSIGLALAENPDLVRRIGHDKELSAARSAEKLGALDQVKLNLPASIRNADIVLLCLPLDEIRKTLEVIAPELKPGAIVMDTSPAKMAVSAWAEELLPDGCAYIGLLPVINPAYLNEVESGVEAAHADLFHHGMVVIAAPPGVPGEAIDLALGLSRLLGADTLFADLAELDGLMASTHILPQLMAISLLNATVDLPGWKEARKLAGRSYSGVTLPVVYQDSQNALREAALLNAENTVRKLDSLIAELGELRNRILEKDSEGLNQKLESAFKGRDTWWQQRVVADWLNVDEKMPELPSLSEIWQQMLVGSRKRPGKKEEK